MFCPHAPEYDYPPFRPPNEAGSALIRITRGCPWNKCEFCGMYKETKFERRPREEVLGDIRRAREIYGRARTIFLADSDNLVHRDLPELVSEIRRVFPEAERLTAYARAKTVLNRKAEFLKAVREAGLDRLHIGLESGDPVVLERMRKGATPQEMIEGGRKALEAGFEVSFYVLCGAGGKDRWKEHARESARVVNAVGPDFIRFRTLTVMDGTPLAEKKRSGEFTLTPPLERLREVELFIDTLDVEDCHLASDHMTNWLWAGGKMVYSGVSGDLPGDKEAMLREVREAIARVDASEEPVTDSNTLYEEGAIRHL